MTNLSDFFYIDGVDDVNAAYVNRLLAATMRAEYRNVETISATKSLVDNDTPIQVLNPSGANRDVILPVLSTDNHQFFISNAGSSWSLVVKNSTGTTLSTLLPGAMALFISNGSLWNAVGAGGVTSLPASSVTFVPYGNIAATDAQAAIQELDDEKAPAAQGVTNGNSHDHNGGDGGQISHTALSSAGTNTHAQIDSHIASTSNPHSVTATQAGATPADGWIAAGEAWTYASTDSPTFTFTVSGDKTAKYYPGMRIKLTQTTEKYFIVTKVSYGSPNTTITVYGGTDYTLANATITSPYYSTSKAPAGFPLDPDKWSIIVTDTAINTQASPTTGTWYNLGSVQITVPIGVWNLSFSVVAWDDVTNQQCSMSSALSTSSSSSSDATFRDYFVGYGTSVVSSNLKKSKVVNLTTKTVYYLITNTGTTGVANLRNKGDVITTELKAVCAYL